MKSERGNVLVYILVAVALFAALSYSLGRNVQSGSTSLDDERASILANQLIAHSQQVQQVIAQMLMTGSQIGDIDFTMPDEAGFGTGAINQVFHPAGGGMNVFNDSDEDFYGSSNADRGWHGQTGTNIEWSESTGTDLIYSFLYVDDSVCSKINEILNGDDTVPADAALDFDVHFINGGGDDDTLETADCAPCEGIYAQCVTDTGVGNVFYTIPASQ